MHSFQPFGRDQQSHTSHLDKPVPGFPQEAGAFSKLSSQNESAEQRHPLTDLDALRAPVSTFELPKLTTRQALRIYGKVREEIIAHRRGEIAEESMTVGARLTMQALTYQDTKNAVQLRDALASVPDADGFTKAFGFATGLIALWRAAHDEFEDRALTRSLPWHIGTMAYRSAMTAVGTVGTIAAGVLLNFPQQDVVNTGFVVATIGIFSVQSAFFRMCQAGYVRQQFAVNLRALFARAAQGANIQEGTVVSDSESDSSQE